MKTNDADIDDQPIPVELITERARKLWQERGGDSKRDIENWLDAEKELRLEQRQIEAAKKENGKGFDGTQREREEAAHASPARSRKSSKTKATAKRQRKA